MCNNAKQNRLTEQNNQIKSEIVDKQIQDGLMRFIYSMNDSLAFNRVYTVEFYNKDMFHVFTRKDSAIFISTLNCSIKFAGYKGIVSFNDYTVAIMDEENIGAMYYDTLCLHQIPLNLLKCIDDSLRFGIAFTLRNGVLIEWNP
jgi:hypothetical protein